MKEILLNYDNITEDQIDKTVVRVKSILVNDKNEALVGYSFDEFQFIGGHVEEGENPNDTIIREIKEETGINVKEKVEPFIKLTRYYKNYKGRDENRNSIIYYYAIRVNEEPKIDKTTYTESEIRGNFTIRKIPLKDLVNEIRKDMLKDKHQHLIDEEMIEVFDLYDINQLIK